MDIALSILFIIPGKNLKVVLLKLNSKNELLNIYLYCCYYYSKF